MIKGRAAASVQNLLGKRVDYFGPFGHRGGSTAETAPWLSAEAEALELFKAFIFHQLELMGLAYTIKAAKAGRIQNQCLLDILEA